MTVCTAISEPMLSLTDLRLALSSRGAELSDSQLKRLRREGLLLVGVAGSTVRNYVKGSGRGG
jgi:hypothetical protein